MLAPHFELGCKNIMLEELCSEEFYLEGFLVV